MLIYSEKTATQFYGYNTISVQILAKYAEKTENNNNDNNKETVRLANRALSRCANGADMGIVSGFEWYGNLLCIRLLST